MRLCWSPFGSFQFRHATVVFGLLVSVAAVTPLLPSEHGLGLAMILGGGVFVIFLSRSASQMSSALLLAFLVRVGIAVVDTYFVRVPGSGGDSAGFEALAASWAADPVVGVMQRVETGSFLISGLAALIYDLVGTSALMIKVILAVLGTLTVWNVFRLSRELWGPRVAKRAGWIAVFYPTLALFSGIFLRESPIAFFASLGMLHAVLGIRGRGAYHLPLAVLGFAAAAAFHTGMVAAITGLLLVGLAEMGRSARQAQAGAFVRYTFLLALVVVGLGIISITGWGLERLGGSFENLDFYSVESTQVLAARGGAAYLEGFTASSPVDVLWKGPVRLVFFLFTPFLWMVRSPSHLLGLLDAALFAIMFWSIFKVRHRFFKDAARRAVFIVFLTTTFAFSLGTSNFGTSIRHRAKVVPLLISLVAVFPWERRIPFELRADLEAEDA